MTEGGLSRTDVITDGSLSNTDVNDHVKTNLNHLKFEQMKIL